MKIVILSGNPKRDGLCQSLIEEVRTGVQLAGAEVDEIRLCDLYLQLCHVCGDGWGTCRESHYCTYGSDGFDDVRARMKECDAVVIATPVYWEETTEALKCFMDRLRRCQFDPANKLKEANELYGKQVLLIASAGGSGNGLINCLNQMNNFCRHTRAIIFDHIGVNRWNSDYKRAAIRAAACAMASGRKNGDTVGL